MSFWIKMRHDLDDDPAVIAISDRTGIDEFGVIGRLQNLWSWADRQSRDGHAPRVTPVWVDRRVRHEGFAQAMIEVGWLISDETGITFPNFDRHNSESAKERALSADRKRAQRERQAGGTNGADDVSRSERDDSVTRVEQSREEKSKGKRVKTSSGDGGYSAEFEDAWAAYPARPGASKADAFKAWSARINAGCEPGAMVAGAQRYAAYVLAVRTEPQFIKQPATFFGPGLHFQQAWELPRQKASIHVLGKQDYRAGIGENGELG